MNEVISKKSSVAEEATSSRRKSSRGRNLSYPFGELALNQSFFVSGASARNITGCAAYAGKVLGRKFVARTMDDGVRVWRVE